MKNWPLSLLALTALVSLLAGFIGPHDGAHAGWWNSIPAFFALLGFLGCLLIILFAKALGKFLLQRKEDYYHAD